MTTPGGRTLSRPALFRKPGTPASGASQLLNAEGVFTALLAWFVFRENVDRRIALFVVALRHLGTARTGAYFSVAPFFGAVLALLMGEPLTLPLVIAGSLMVLGIWLHLTEHHAHEHIRGVLFHAHAHMHDEHHQHAHDFPWDGPEPHDHPHGHEPLTHVHPHYPDTHHRHDH